MPNPIISIIIATTAESHRKESLYRAINSINNQEDCKSQLIIIANGTIFDPDLINSLKKIPDINFHYLEIGNLPNALHYGVKQVKTSFFSFLDDDDIFLKNTFKEKLDPMLKNTEIDFVVTNGFNYRNNCDKLRTINFPKESKNAANMVLEENWLASCGAVYRSSSFEPDYFKEIPKYLEWTYIGFKISNTKRGHFINTPTFRIFDSVNSLSKSIDYHEGVVNAIQKITEIAPQALKKETKKKYGKALHDTSSEYLKNNKIKESILNHLKSLTMPNGITYLSYSRHIISKIINNLFSRGT